jgi:DNA helicase-2/ATP-dependent DNA helicase PcrA
MDILDSLNPVQAEAVQAIEGPVLVLAGPGSGKTRVLTHRIAYLIRTCGVRPHNILAVTFTNKAAQEMTARLDALIGNSARALTVGTFHAICARILRREAAYLGLNSNFAIYDEDDQERLITRALKELNLDTKLYRPSSVQAAISRAKNELITAQTYRPPTYWHEAVARAFERYETLKAENNALDFDDLLLKAEELFRVHDEVRERYQQRYHFIMVDEFQDTNKAQYDLIMHLASSHQNIFVVGDEDQSIYSWRGADFRNVLRFRSDLAQAKVFMLEQNYRSTQTILDAAQAIISHNTQRTKKKLWTENPQGGAIKFFEAYDENEEADYVVGETQRLVAEGETRLGDCAIMYRTNAQSRGIEDALVRRGVPYKLVGGTRFYQRREIKDVLSYLRLIHNLDDEISLTRIINVPQRGIGDKTIAELNAFSASLGTSPARALLSLVSAEKPETMLAQGRFSARAANLILGFAKLLGALVQAKDTLPLSELLSLVLERTAYLAYLRDGTEEGEDRINNVRELYSVTQNYAHLDPQAALTMFLEETALLSSADEVDQQQDRVTLLTLHTAKGLEYDCVFIVGMEEGICPHARSLDDPDAMEEERRLCYVGITRAKKRLYLVRTFRRTLYGSSEVREASRFLRDIPAKLAEGNVLHSAPAHERGATATWPQRRTGGGLGNRPARAPAPTLAEGRPMRRAKATQPERPTRQTVPEEQPARASDLPPVVVASADAAPSFAPGQRVTHPVFGEGTVLASKNSGDAEEVTVAFEGRGIKRLMASYASLQKA